ncbi:MAG: YciI family protein [Candidatus Rokuibacteriota bacterium]
MQYLLMCCFDEKRWAKLPDAEKDKIMKEYGDVLEDLVRSGHFRAGARLYPASTATTVREKNGKRVVTDGPFAETKEQLGGYHLVECEGLDEAIAIAGRIPTLPAGGAIEVRPVEPAPAR